MHRFVFQHAGISNPNHVTSKTCNSGKIKRKISSKSKYKYIKTNKYILNTLKLINYYIFHKLRRLREIHMSYLGFIPSI